MTALPSTRTPSLPITDLSEAVGKICSWLEQRENRLKAEARLSVEVKLQKEQTAAYAKELKTNLKALKKKLEGNDRYLKIQMKDREKARKDATNQAMEMMRLAYLSLDRLEKLDLSEAPPETIKIITDMTTTAVSGASQILKEMYPAGPLATLV